MSRHLGRIAVVSASTMGSRVLGLARDILIFAALGASQWSSAFLFAFTLPNLFRRLLGEGALTSALVPVLAEARETDGDEGAFALVNQTVTRVGIALVALTLGMIGMLSVVLFVPGLAERWYLGAHFGIILMPYMILVCLAAVLAAALNVYERFAVPALSAVWLNLSMIIALGGFGFALGESAGERVYFLCAGVLVGGVVQVVAPLWAMQRTGWQPRWDARSTPRLREGWSLLLPGLAGAGILQVNIVVSRVLALAVNETAVSELYLANRLVELPLGVFTIAVATVVFPEIARLAARADREGMRHAYGQGMRLILAITIPAAIGLIVLAQPVLVVLFEWGRFDVRDVERTTPVLVIFACTVPLYSLAIFSTRCFHSMKDTRTPVRMAWWAFVANTVLSLLLMFPLGTIGLALANLGSSALQGIGLTLWLRRREHAFTGARLARACARIALAAVGMALAVWVIGPLAGGAIFADNKLQALWAVVIGIPVGMGVYFGLLWVLRFEDLYLVRQALRRVVGGGKRT